MVHQTLKLVVGDIAVSRRQRQGELLLPLHDSHCRCSLRVLDVAINRDAKGQHRPRLGNFRITETA